MPAHWLSIVPRGRDPGQSLNGDFMTAGTNITGDGLSCHRCSHRARPGDRYCERCGSGLGVLPAPWQPASGNGHPHGGQGPAGAAPGRDGTTRYLCAAAHLDEEFCDEAIAEFLVEPVRAIPPSPGVDSAAVLREAVAAQTRRRIRDALLLVLLVVLALVNRPTVLFWAVAVVAMVAVVAILHAFGGGRTRRKLAMLVVVASPALFLLLPFLLLPLAMSSRSSPFGLDALELSIPQLLPDSTWPTLLISGLLLLVLIVQRVYRRQAYEQQLPAGSL